MPTYSAALDEVLSAPAAFAIHWLDANREPGGASPHGRASSVCGTWTHPRISRSSRSPTRTAWSPGASTASSRSGTSSGNTRSSGNGDELALNHRGDWADVEMTFDLGGDRRRSGALWDESRMGLVLFLQDAESGAVLQAAHTTLP